MKTGKIIQDKVDTNWWYAHKYCKPVMFAPFVCALLIFVCAGFLQNTKPENPGKLSWNIPRRGRQWFTPNNGNNGTTSQYPHLHLVEIFILSSKFYNLFLAWTDSTYHIINDFNWKINWHKKISQWFFFFSFVDHTFITFRSFWIIFFVLIIFIFILLTFRLFKESSFSVC